MKRAGAASGGEMNRRRFLRDATLAGLAMGSPLAAEKSLFAQASVNSPIRSRLAGLLRLLKSLWSVLNRENPS